MKKLQSFDEIIIDAKQKTLYKKLIFQLNKDLSLSNIPIVFSEETLPQELKTNVFQCIQQLIHEDFSSYLNLLYRIDIPEEKIKNLEPANTQQYVETVSFLVISREWQKVWLKENF